MASVGGAGLPSQENQPFLELPPQLAFTIVGRTCVLGTGSPGDELLSACTASVTLNSPAMLQSSAGRTQQRDKGTEKFLPREKQRLLRVGLLQSLLNVQI